MNWLLTMLLAPLLVLWMFSEAVNGQWWLEETTTETLEETTTSNSVECQCVKYYLCINGTIDTTGSGIFNARSGSRSNRRSKRSPQPPHRRDSLSTLKCPSIYDVCCMPPTVPTTPTPSPVPTLPADTPCECVPFLNCPAERLVSDGKGNTSLEGLEFISSHSSCPHVLTVCCAIEPTTPPPITTPDSNNDASHCQCVDLYQCDTNGTIKTSGVGLLDIRTTYRFNPNPDIQCEDPNQICCNKPGHKIITATEQPSTTTTSTTISTTVEPETTTQSCGTRNDKGVLARIQGFENGESQFGEFPWVAAIMRQEFMSGKLFHLFVGGGTLIHPRVVITAAHKVDLLNKDVFWVRLGEWDTRTTHEPIKHVNIKVEDVIIHPQYVRGALHNDFALLILEKESPKHQKHINRVCIAEDLSQVDGHRCVINGWGKDGFDVNSTYQTIMKSLTLPIVPSEVCQMQLRKTRLGPYFILDDSFLCAGGELGKDACTGDGGGPLACPRKNDSSHYLLVGMTAWGIGCGQDGLPGVYVNIPSGHDWIRQEIENLFPTPTTTTEPPYEDFSNESENKRSEILNEERERRRLDRIEKKKETRRERKQRERRERRQRQKQRLMRRERR